VDGVCKADVRLDVDVKQGLIYEDSKDGEVHGLRRTFLNMNWTGYEPPVVVKPTNEEPAATGPRYKPLDTILRVLMLAVNDLDPGASFASIELIQEKDKLELRVGDTLPKPHDFAVVHAIKNTGIEFAFKQDGRPNESLAPMSMDDGNLITKLGDGGVRMAKGSRIPRVKRKQSERPRQTEELGNNVFLLGTEDLEYFGKNYAAILTDEVQTATHYDENGKRAGIEIKSIASGSVASRHGAQAGDVLISINGTAVSSEHEAINFVKNNQDQYSVWNVVVERLGRRETIVYTDPNN
jgi:hypothetical protein